MSTNATIKDVLLPADSQVGDTFRFVGEAVVTSVSSELVHVSSHEGQSVRLGDRSFHLLITNVTLTPRRRERD